MMQDACILLAGQSAWAFEEFAKSLSEALWVEISTTPRKWNYVLSIQDEDFFSASSFISLNSIKLAADKRELAKVFSENNVPTPRTFLINDVDEIEKIIAEHPGQNWCLKFPTSCGGAGHRLVNSVADVPDDWPRPFVLQEFVRLIKPEVFRTYVAGGTIFGFVARRYPPGVKPSPWVAHARGARYEIEKEICPEAIEVAEAAFRAAGLFNSFGCVDLIRRDSGEWLALEVGTDGIYNHVDRDIGDYTFETDLKRRVAIAFWGYVGTTPPWSPGSWHPQK